MKKFLSFIFIMILCVSVVGCGNKELSKADGVVKPSKNLSEAVPKVTEEDISKNNESENDSISEEVLVPEDITTAMYIPIDDWKLFASETGPFSLIGEDIEYLDIDGNQITEDNLVAGNMVEITSAGIMLESYPGQLAGVTKVKVVEFGSPEDVSQYQEIIDELTIPETDINEIPSMNVGYKTDLADVTMLVEANGGYQFNNETNVEIGDALPIDEMTEPLPVANIGEKVDIELTFSKDIVSSTIWKLTDETELISPDEESDSHILLSNVTVGTYVVQVEFANGDAEYRFVCEE